MTCPKCGSEHLKVENTRRRHGMIQRQRVCRDCLWSWLTVEVNRDWYRRVTADVQKEG